MFESKSICDFRKSKHLEATRGSNVHAYLAPKSTPHKYFLKIIPLDMLNFLIAIS